MAQLTLIRGQRMRLCLTGRSTISPVMTAAGSARLAGKQGMIEIHIRPIRGTDMACIAGQRGIHMLRCRRSAGGDSAVMTRLANIRRLAMRKGQNQRQPSGA